MVLCIESFARGRNLQGKRRFGKVSGVDEAVEILGNITQGLSQGMLPIIWNRE